jgi:hypothetical protein
MKSSMSLTRTPARAHPAAHRSSPLPCWAAARRPDGGFAAVEQTARERLGKDLIRSRSAADQDRIDRASPNCWPLR